VFRQLYEALLDTPLDDRNALLSQWTARTSDELDTVTPLRHRPASVGDAPGNQLSTLYALSRVSDFLIEEGCPPGDFARGSAGGRTVDQDVLAAHTAFFDNAGLRRYEHAESFSPFHHEIFAVTRDDTLDTVIVDGVLWPGFFFGDLLFCRAGVHVRAPAALIDAATATTSTLYFTSRRVPRRTNDLSDGWGSNSQWRTDFHRNYADSGGLHVNWDGRTYLGDPFDVPPNDPNDALTLAQRRELLLHRCFVTAPPPEQEWDMFPFHDRISLRTSTWPLVPGSILPDPAR
jgi:hypothetical protein